MSLPFSIRHYIPETDLSFLSRMLTETESIDRDGEDTSEDVLRQALEWSNYRPAQDVWIAESNGELVGYGVALEQPSRRCTLYVVVHPATRRKGLGSQLLELIIARAREVGSRNLLIYANEHNDASHAFLTKQDFLPVGSSGVMRVPAELEVPSFEFPAGFTLKRYSEVNDPLILLAALNECYLGMWGHQHNDRPTEEELRSPRFLKYYDADDILLLFDTERTVTGICSVKSEGRKDESDGVMDLLDAPGVIRKYRNLGYQRQLVLAGLRHLREHGQRAVKLEFYGDDEKMLDIYRGLGFEMLQRYVAYHKELA